MIDSRLHHVTIMSTDLETVNPVLLVRSRV